MVTCFHFYGIMVLVVWSFCYSSVFHIRIAPPSPFIRRGSASPLPHPVWTTGSWHWVFRLMAEVRRCNFTTLADPELYQDHGGGGGDQGCKGDNGACQCIKGFVGPYFRGLSGLDKVLAMSSSRVVRVHLPTSAMATPKAKNQ